MECQFQQNCELLTDCRKGAFAPFVMLKHFNIFAPTGVINKMQI